jgi:hypothetical protein
VRVGLNKRSNANIAQAKSQCTSNSTSIEIEIQQYVVTLLSPDYPVLIFFLGSHLLVICSNSSGRYYSDSSVKYNPRR